MTSLAKIEANRANAQRSTGPRTAAGKAVAARNAVRHGAFAVPIVPGEDPAAWEAHRAGVRASLAPAGLLEERLADRVALVLWRLDRLARYETASVTAGIERAVLPKAASDSPLSDLLADRASAARRAAGSARAKAEVAERTVQSLAPVAALLRNLPDRPADEPVSGDIAAEVFDAAGLAERERLRPIWRAEAALLPGDGTDERVVRYEGHLHRLLTATLHELERMQAIRAGTPAADG